MKSPWRPQPCVCCVQGLSPNTGWDVVIRMWPSSVAADAGRRFLREQPRASVLQPRGSATVTCLIDARPPVADHIWLDSSRRTLCKEEKREPMKSLVWKRNSQCRPLSASDALDRVSLKINLTRTPVRSPPRGTRLLDVPADASCRLSVCHIEAHRKTNDK